MFCSSLPLTNSLYLAAVGVNTTLLSLSVSYTPSTNPFCKKKNMQSCRRNGRQVTVPSIPLIRSTNKRVKNSAVESPIIINVRSLTLLFAKKTKKKKTKKKIHSYARNIPNAHTTTGRIGRTSHGQFFKIRRKFRVSSISRQTRALLTAKNDGEEDFT